MISPNIHFVNSVIEAKKDFSLPLCLSVRSTLKNWGRSEKKKRRKKKVTLEKDKALFD